MAMAVAGKPLPEPDLTWSDDMVAMHRVLSGNTDAGQSGTAFRFGMAYWAAQEGKKTHLTGSARLLERPISPLVEALEGLGASLKQRKDGSWDITGARLSGGKVRMDATVSSQFISALMLIEPLMKKKLSLKLEGDEVSAPYIEMTKQICQLAEWPVEADWSAGIVWALRASCMGESVRLNGLGRRSIQGDSQWSLWGLNLGFSAAYEGNSLVVRGLPSRPSHALTLDLTATPDLAQPIVAGGILMRREVQLTGLQTLNWKEIARFDALVDALKLLGISVVTEGASGLSFDAKGWSPSEEGIQVDAMGDHRMAFFWAMVGLEQPLEIADEGCVSKSYPDFWASWREYAP
jgi:3-phosphoshikimate 1-carboxyvinyltransferase